MQPKSTEFTYTPDEYSERRSHPWLYDVQVYARMLSGEIGIIHERGIPQNLYKGVGRRRCDICDKALKERKEYKKELIRQDIMKDPSRVYNVSSKEEVQLVLEVLSQLREAGELPPL